MVRMQKVKCPYVNRHKFCPKCGKDNPKVCEEETELLPDSLVDTPEVEPPQVTPQAETLTFEKPKGRGRRG